MIIAEKKYGILTLKIDNFTHRNTLNTQMVSQLTKELSEAQVDADTLVVLLTGCANVFCAGADIKETDTEKLDHELELLFSTMANFTKPIVAQVTGPAVAEGLTLLMYCDLVFATPQALFSMPSVALARTPRFGVACLMANQAGFTKTAQKLLLSEPITANEALDMCLITEIIDEEHIDNVVASKVSRLACLPTNAVRATKELLVATRAQKLSQLKTLETKLYAEQITTDEAKEATRAFLEGRTPIYRKDNE